jgi:circadian clock protein KaiC
VATGIEGFDILSQGGLPLNRTSLLIGGPGAGKTIFALQCLVHAVRKDQAPGIFVSFEERPSEIIENAAGFDWGLADLSEQQIFFLDAHLSPATVKSGEFDLTGTIAMLTAKKKEIGARWIVFDGIDVLLTLLQDPVAEMREIYRIRDWLADNNLTAIITAKYEEYLQEKVHYGFMQFMADCVVQFGKRQEDRVSLKWIQMTKYRGSGFAGAEFPLTFGPSGIEVATIKPATCGEGVSHQRVSTGFGDLDALLDGGVFRGSSTLISGLPGTAKTTLGGKFAEAACGRSERTLFVSYDESAEQIERNLVSVGINFAPHRESGLLRMFPVRTEATSAEELLTRLKSEIRTFQPRCIVIDPLTAIGKASNPVTARSVASRFMYLIKDEGITALVTALSETDDPLTESTNLQISTIADTWIHLSYLVAGGERNRALTIVKSRGTSHSNQVRELLLSKSGPALTNVYTAGGEVLMGTLRWEKEADEANQKSRQLAEYEQKREELRFSEAKIGAQITALEMELEKQRVELNSYSNDNDARRATVTERENELRRKRGSPADRPSGKSGKKKTK